MHHCNTEYWLLILLSGYCPDWCYKQKNVISAVFFIPTVVSLKEFTIIRRIEQLTLSKTKFDKFI